MPDNRRLNRERVERERVGAIIRVVSEARKTVANWRAQGDLGCRAGTAERLDTITSLFFEDCIPALDRAITYLDDVESRIADPRTPP
jgi:hypothetical protein